MGLKVERQPLVDETRGPDAYARATRYQRTLVLSKSASDIGLTYMVLVTLTASDEPGIPPEATLQLFGAEHAPISLALDGEAFAAFVDEANAWLEQHPVKAPPTS